MIAELTIATVCTYILYGIFNITLAAIGLVVAIAVSFFVYYIRGG